MKECHGSEGVHQMLNEGIAGGVLGLAVAKVLGHATLLSTRDLARVMRFFNGVCELCANSSPRAASSSESSSDACALAARRQSAKEQTEDAIRRICNVLRVRDAGDAYYVSCCRELARFLTNRYREELFVPVSSLIATLDAETPEGVESRKKGQTAQEFIKTDLYRLARDSDTAIRRARRELPQWETEVTVIFGRLKTLEPYGSWRTLYVLLQAAKMLRPCMQLARRVYRTWREAVITRRRAKTGFYDDDIARFGIAMSPDAEEEEGLNLVFKHAECRVEALSPVLAVELDELIRKEGDEILTSGGKKRSFASGGDVKGRGPVIRLSSDVQLLLSYVQVFHELGLPVTCFKQHLLAQENAICSMARKTKNLEPFFCMLQIENDEITETVVVKQLEAGGDQMLQIGDGSAPLQIEASAAAASTLEIEDGGGEAVGHARPGPARVDGGPSASSSSDVRSGEESSSRCSGGNPEFGVFASTSKPRVPETNGGDAVGASEVRDSLAVMQSSGDVVGVERNLVETPSKSVVCGDTGSLQTEVIYSDDDELLLDLFRTKLIECMLQNPSLRPESITRLADFITERGIVEADSKMIQRLVVGAGRREAKVGMVDSDDALANMPAARRIAPLLASVISNRWTLFSSAKVRKTLEPWRDAHQLRVKVASQRRADPARREREQIRKEADAWVYSRGDSAEGDDEGTAHGGETHADDGESHFEFRESEVASSSFAEKGNVLNFASRSSGRGRNAGVRDSSDVFDWKENRLRGEHGSSRQHWKKAPSFPGKLQQGIARGENYHKKTCARIVQQNS